MKKISLPYYFIAALSALLWLPSLLTKGMFMDGIYNAIFAQNLANGISTFWAPQTNDYSNPAYWNNPPLSMLTLGWYYKIWGDHFVVDKIYSLSCAVIQLLLLAWTWKIFWHQEKEIGQYFWLPCLLWLISPLTSWCYSNNMMENTMSVFTTSAVISFLLFLRSKKHLLTYSFAGAGFVFLACLTKGPTGLFPLAIPLFFIFSQKGLSLKQLSGYAISQLIFLALLFVLIFSFPEPKNFLSQYIALQLAPALNHSNKPETETHIIFKELLIMLLPLLILYFTSLFIKDNRENKNTYVVKAVGFVLSGLAASLPIALSMKQRKFYLLPSLPMFALGFSILVIPLLKFIELKTKDYVTNKISMVIKWGCILTILVCVSLCIKNKNTFSRDKDILTDIENVLPMIGNEEAVCSDWKLYGEWSLRAYCTRYYNKKMYTPDRVAETKFYMTKPGQTGDKLSPEARKIYAGATFDLYQTEF